MKSAKKDVLILALITGVVLAGLAISNNFKFKHWESKDDYRIAVMADNGMRLISISRERKMVNTANVKGDIKVWVPKGYGWYIADRVKKLLESEKKTNLAGEFFFYNFGFVPDNLIFTNDINKFGSDWELTRSIGLVNYLQYRWYLPQLMEKDEEIKTDLDKENQIGDLLIRDFADNRLVGEEVRINLVNSSGVNGLASWLTDRMEWEGMTVVGLETRDTVDGVCTLSMGKEVKKTQTYKAISQLWKCQESVDDGMGDLEVELVLGKEFPKVIKY